mgnify:CR=1 FL=1
MKFISRASKMRALRWSKHTRLTKISRAFWVMVDSFTISWSDSILESEISVKAFGVFNLAKMVLAPNAWTYYFDTVEGLVSWDNVKIYEKTNGSYENLEIDTVNLADNSVTFVTAPTWTNFTVANDTKLELLPKTPSYQKARAFSFVDVRYRFADTIANAYNEIPENVENRSLEFMNNLEERYWSLRSSPSVIAEKGNAMMLKFEKYFETTKDRDRYLAQAPRACVVEMNSEEIVSPTDNNQTKYKIIFELSEIIFTSYEMATGTDEIYAISAEANCFYSNTDWRAVRVKIYNENDGTFYGI